MHEHGEWDLQYVEQLSWRTDIAILLNTPAALLGDNTGS
jgi:lipopolysaccharide/colanic/teichoic acid biosynthesis glycosyltransferase